MTSAIKESFYIPLSKKEKIQKVKWCGYSIDIIKDCDDANEALNRLIEKKKNRGNYERK